MTGADGVPVAGRAPVPLVLAVVAGFYWLWLHTGTRPNPPVPYDEYKTGLTFAGVRELLKHEQDAAYERGQYMFVSRSTVLGRMHQLKREQYQRYLDQYVEGDEDLPF